MDAVWHAMRGNGRLGVAGCVPYGEGCLGRSGAGVEGAQGGLQIAWP